MYARCIRLIFFINLLQFLLSVSYARKISSIHEPNKIWANGSTINILFFNGSKNQKDRVINLSSRWLDYANLKFNFYNKREIRKSQAHIKIQIGRKCKGNWSAVGKDSLGLDISMCLSDLRSISIIHEFGHALGLKHEHLHPDFQKYYLRDNYKELCNKSYGPNCKKLFPGRKTRTMTIGYYDPTSVMHYSFLQTALYADGLLKKDFLNYRFGSSGILSKEDRRVISRLYPYKNKSSSALTDYEDDLVKVQSNLTCLQAIEDTMLDPLSSNYTSCEVGNFECYINEYNRLTRLVDINYCIKP